MDDTSAIRALSALAQPTRLAAFRALVSAFPGSLPAGGIARQLDVPHNTLSAHLAILSRARLVSSSRSGRTVNYAAALERVQSLVTFLTEDCCAGRPELCRPLATALARHGTVEPGTNERERDEADA